MNSSNSFNICPHCNNSNSLNARYCARCGSKLVVPEEVVVCPKCHTRNSPLANFCRNCGTPFKADDATKICPKCGRVVSADSNVCVCGHSFATVGKIAPSDSPRADAPAEMPVEEVKAARKPGKASGRAFAIIALVFLLVFAYAVIAPASLRLDFLAKIDNGVIENASGRQYGYELVMNEGRLVDMVKEIIANPSNIGAIAYSAKFVLLVTLAVFILSVVIHLIVVIIRIFTGRRSKRGNWFYFIMAALTTVVCLLLMFNLESNGSAFMTVVVKLFQLDADFGTVGYMFGVAIPVYYWFFFLYSLIAKRHAPKAIACDCCKDAE